MKHAWLIPLALLAVAGGGYALSAAAGWRVHTACVALYAGAALLASGLALVPVFLSRGASQAAVAQAALIGSAVHLFGCLLGAAGLFYVLRAGMPMVYWILAFYLATLAALVVVFSRVIVAAPAAGPAPRQ